MSDSEKSHSRPSHVLEDPSAQAIARTYARSFLAAAGDGTSGEALEEFGSFIDDVLEKNPEFGQVLTSGIVGRDEKLGLIDRVMSGRGSDLFTNFLRVLTKHDRLDLLPLIRNEAQLQYEKNEGKQRVLVRAAKALSSGALDKISSQLKSKFGFEPIIEEQIDDSLLGGIVIQVGDTVYDSSLRTKMKQLRESLRERALNEIQSGRDRFSNPEGN
ncbi:MAG: ATP synthase F1 subunit delta [Planctomycetaceae bacterium]